MTDATIDLEQLYAEAATAPVWWNIRNPIHKHVITSFRDQDAARELKARLEIRWHAETELWASDTIPGYDH